MKPGDFIGIGMRGAKEVGLFCEVTKLSDGCVKFWVINGAWEGTLDVDGDVTAFSGGYVVNVVPGCVVLYEGPCPHDDYNDAIKYMNDALKRPVRHWIHLRCYRLTSGPRGQWKRFKRACAAFRQAWVGKQKCIISKVDDEDEFDDSIPF